MSLPADDLLSAFHDGEVNSAECAAVEQRLATSVEGRCELSEIRQISSLLKALPRERLPLEFPQQVLQRIEREMLVPSQRVGEAGRRTRVAAGTTGSSRRWVGAVALLTSAAGLLLLIRAIDDRGSISFSEIRKEPVAHQRPMAVEESSRGGGAAAPMTGADAPAAGSRSSGVLGGAAGTNFIAADSSLSSPLPPAGVAARESGTLFFDQAALRDTQIGGAVQAMQTEGNEVAVVWLTVVDRQEGLAGVQLLLSNKEIARADSGKKLDKATKPNAVADHQMHAVFVEADAEHLTAMLKRLRESDLLQSVEVDQPIELAQLGEVQVDLERSTLARRFATPPPASAEKKIASATSSPKIAAKSEQAGAKRPQDVKDQPPNQVTLKFSRETLVQNQLSQQTRNRGLSRSVPHSQSSDRKNVEQPSTDQRPMQVLFVVVDQSQAGKLQVTPNHSPKPAVTTPSKARTEPVKPIDQDGAA